MVHLVELVSLLDVCMRLHSCSTVVWHAVFWSGSVLHGVIRVRDHCRAIFVSKSSLNVLPQVMERHEHIVLKLLAVNAHLLPLDLLLSSCPDVWLCQKLQLVKRLRHGAVLIKCVRHDKVSVSSNLLTELVDLVSTPV